MSEKKYFVQNNTGVFANVGSDLPRYIGAATTKNCAEDIADALNRESERADRAEAKNAELQKKMQSCIDDRYGELLARVANHCYDVGSDEAKKMNSTHIDRYWKHREETCRRIINLRLREEFGGNPPRQKHHNQRIDKEKNDANKADQ